MTLAEMVHSALSNEEFEIELDGMTLTGKYDRNEVLSGQIADIDDPDEVVVIRWYSLCESKTYSYTVIRCRKVVDLDEI